MLQLYRSVYTLTIVYQQDMFTCVCSHQITTGDKKIEMSTNLAYATLPHPATNQQLNEK